MITVTHQHTQVAAALAGQGFQLNGAPGHYERHDGAKACLTGNWLIFHLIFQTLNGAAKIDPLTAQPAAPGLWKSAADGVGRTFELPLRALAGGLDEDNWLADSVAWASDTAVGSVPRGWESPAQELSESWIPTQALTVQAGRSLRQGAVNRTDGVFTLQVPLLFTLPDLPPYRREWLSALLHEAQSSWRMVRVRRVETGAVLAELSLTGAPAPMLEDLVLIGLESLRGFVRWILEPVEFLAGNVPCRALEMCKPSGLPRKEDKHDARE